MRPQSEDVMKLAERIIELKQLLASAQAEWDQMFRDEAGWIQARRVNGNNVRPLNISRTRTTNEESGSGRMMAMIYASPQRSFGPIGISKELNIPIGTVRTNLSKMVAKGKLEKRGHAEYGAVTGGDTTVYLFPSEKEAPEGTSSREH
jgi:hypothetical protein